MGLGKTIQTIALLAHLACNKGMWGPHLIVVPTSVMLNWEMELKKWCPAFKVLTYYGSQKERRLKRVGWTKPNAFHVCITSYKLVIQDHASFRRKRWYYFILDEAQHIKNFKSQRWQLLLNFQTSGRLLLTGTPLQNNLMELWSLMHFLMPDVFRSHRNFKEWFSNPLTGMVEDTQEYNESLVRRLHKVLRPFLLRRLKNEVEKQLPSKYEHVVYCSLSKRQRYLYDDFMSRAKTRETLAGGNFMSVINVLMQLRKVCNHPNLFEPRPTVSPFVVSAHDAPSPEDTAPRLAFDVSQRHPLHFIRMEETPLSFVTHELRTTAYAAYRGQASQNHLSENVDLLTAYREPPPCPKGKFRMYISYTKPPMHKISTDGTVPLSTVLDNKLWIKPKKDINLRMERGTFLLHPFALPRTPSPLDALLASQKKDMMGNVGQPQQAKMVKLSATGRPMRTITSPKKYSDGNSGALSNHSKPPHEEEKAQQQQPPAKRKRASLDEENALASKEAAKKDVRRGIFCSLLFSKDFVLPSTLEEDREAAARTSVESLTRLNSARVDCMPLFGADLVESFSFVRTKCPDSLISAMWARAPASVADAYRVGLDWRRTGELGAEAKRLLRRFHLYVPNVLTEGRSSRRGAGIEVEAKALRQRLAALSPLQFHLQLPEARLIEYDCGKLHALGRLLSKLRSGGHRVLLFTQMTRMLDVLEAFLNYYGHTYLRLDGSTKVEQRQALTERFNNSTKYFCFILSTRSGGVGINLTGADTVVFYDR